MKLLLALGPYSTLIAIVIVVYSYFFSGGTRWVEYWQVNLLLLAPVVLLLCLVSFFTTRKYKALNLYEQSLKSGNTLILILFGAFSLFAISTLFAF
ncbi:MAG: hypothetical protein HWD86_06105 [Kangiellaceae bacterium]|nr:hypothetical protein [Kangiellaceae bacterium]